MPGPESRVLPMFPLGSVVVPHQVIPLHVFEPRYRALTEACLAGDQRFGVVLIERGHEVGGGDVRFGTGTVARIVESGRLEDGRWVLAAVGEQRLRIRSWITEEPYPIAEVELLDEPVRDFTASTPDELSGRAEVERALGRVAALVAELGLGPLPDSIRLDADPVRASWEAAAMAPIGPLDRQRVLELDDTAARLSELCDQLAGVIEVLAHRLAGS